MTLNHLQPLSTKLDLDRTNYFKMDKFTYRKDVGKNCFTNMVVEEWNKQSKHVVSTGTVDTFKKWLDISMDEENRSCHV